MSITQDQKQVEVIVLSKNNAAYKMVYCKKFKTDVE